MVSSLAATQSREYACVCMQDCVGGCTQVLQVSLRKSQNSQQASAVFLPPCGQPQTSLVPSRLSWYITYVCGLGEPDEDTHCWA